MSKRTMIIAAVLLVMIGVGFAYRHLSAGGVSSEGEVVTSSTHVTEKWVYRCGDTTTVWDGPAAEEMVGLDLSVLAERFPAGDGWSLTAGLPQSLLLTRHVQEFSPAHAALRHLGIYGDYVAVYEGPLGCSDRVWRVSKTLVTALPPDMQERLKQAMAFDQQTEPVKTELRREWEFADERTAAAVLENLDELQD